MGIKEIKKLLKDKNRLRGIIDNDDTKEGKAFDLMVMGAIGISVILAFVESSVNVDEFSFNDVITKSLTKAGWFKLTLTVLEYILTAFFTIEYALRLYVAEKKKDYALSFFGIVDFLATIPQLLSIFIPQLKYLTMMRSFRLIRIFRVLKLFAFINEGYLLLESIRKSMTKLIVYFLFVSVLVCVLGTVMFIVEGNMPGTTFRSIPDSIYWAIVTLTTVGYGDITPVTVLGKVIASMIMILGYTIIAVPTGIVSATIIDVSKKKPVNNKCDRCGTKLTPGARYCHRCGERIG